MKKKLKRGFTLVELMIVVAIYGVRKYIANAKTAEARNSLGQIAKDASSAYAREGMAGAVLALGGTADVSNKLCAKATKSVPDVKGKIKGQKYQSSPEDWAKDAAAQHTGFACLKFTMTDPQYYMYTYDSDGLGAAGAYFNAIANGDLNGDDTLSTFILGGEVKTAGAGKGGLEVVVAPNFLETNPEE